MGYRRSSKYFSLLTDESSMSVFTYIQCRTLGVDGDGRWCFVVEITFSGDDATMPFGFIEAKCTTFLKPPIIRRELICIYSNLVHNVTHQLPPGVWQEQAQTLTSFLYLAVSNTVYVLRRVEEVFVRYWECLNDGSNKGFYRLPYGWLF